MKSFSLWLAYHLKTRPNLKNLKERLSDDLDSALTGMKKERIFDALAEMNEFEIPESMIMNEMINLRKGSAAQMGKEYEKLKDEEFPIENFRKRSKKGEAWHHSK